MNNNIAAASESFIQIVPKSNSCYDFSENGSRLRKTVFLIPHVIRHSEDSEIITWRCNWGHMCEAKCRYAMAKSREANYDGCQ
jgi:hypothetical protein